MTDTTGYGTERPGEDTRSIGDLLGDVTQNLSTLMRQELELAKAEVRQDVSTAGKAAGMLGGAGVAGWLALLFLSLTVMYLLANVMDVAWAALIVAAIWAVVGAVLFVSGRRRMATVSPVPERTVETIKEDVRWVQNRNR